MDDIETQRPPYRMALGVVLATLALYVITLAPTTQFWDTSEYIAAAKVLGIPHPPGNPLFVMMAHVWGWIPWASGYAARINLFAATTSAVAAGCWFLVGERWMRTMVPARWPRRLAALAGAVVAATAFTVWNQSVVNEKVYTLSLLSIALILWLIVRWDDQPAGEAHDHHLLLIVYLLALTSTNHMMGVLVGPVVVILLYPPLMEKRAPTDQGRILEWGQWAVFCGVFALVLGTGLGSFTYLYLALGLYVLVLGFAIWAGNWRFALVALGVAVVGLSVYLFLPIRAAHFPGINEGEPTTWAALRDVLTRAQYGKPPVTENPMYPSGSGNPGHTLGLFGSQMLNYFQYFGWQFGRDFPGRMRGALAALFALFGAIGAARHWATNRRHAAAMTVLMFTFTIALVYYLNFKYGASQYPEQNTLAHEVRERDYFFICSFALWGIWVGMGLAALMEWVQDGLRARVPNDARRWIYATPVLAFALIPLWGNRLTASRAHETLARDFAYDLLQSVEPYGILVTAGDNDTFPLWYAQEVEGIRRDVTVVNLSLANTDWYLRQMQRRPVEAFDPANAPALYRNHPWPMPSGPPMDMSPDSAAAIQLAYAIPQKQVLRFGTVPITLDPERKDYLERADVVVLKIIQDQLGKRPIYFSRTVGGYADAFGLSAYLEGQGFARKLVTAPLVANDSMAALPELGFVNLPRTVTLLTTVYHGATAARHRPRGWVDRPSEGILFTYGIVYQSVASGMLRKDGKLANALQGRADSVFKNTSFQSTSGF